MELAPPLPKPAATFGFKRCFRLCLPALLIGALFRISLLAVLPNACYSPDGGSYFEAAQYLLDKGRLKLNEKRRWVYPIALVGLAAIPMYGGSTRTIALAQHLLGLACVIGGGWVVGHLTVRPAIWVPLATILFAVWPSMLYYEHEVMAETLFVGAIILTIALAFPIGAIKERRRLFWFILSAGLIVATKPHGRGIWLGCLMTAALITRNPLNWRWESWVAAAFGLVMIVTSGSSQQSSWLWLNSSLPLVKTDGAKWLEYRQALAPLVFDALPRYALPLKWSGIVLACITLDRLSCAIILQTSNS